MAAEKRRPALAILTDFPGFHLRLARKLKPKGIRNVYYICPQFWAWRPWRANLVRRRFAKALCIFPFEEKFFSHAGCRQNLSGIHWWEQCRRRRTGNNSARNWGWTLAGQL